MLFIAIIVLRILLTILSAWQKCEFYCLKNIFCCEVRGNKISLLSGFHYFIVVAICFNDKKLR